METIKYEKKERVAHIRLNRPEQRNALNRQMARDLRKIWEDFKNDDEVWVGIISGEGKSFCTGADVKEMNHEQWQLKDSLLLGEESALPSINNVHKPIISSVQGHAYGAGLILMLESDIRIAANDAMFCIPEGIINVPFLYSPFIFEHIPKPIACEMIFCANSLSASRAKELGIINYNVNKDDLLNETLEIAQKVSKLGPLSNFAAKKLYTRSRNMDFQNILYMIEDIASPVWNSEDAKEGKNAFIEKREPIWKLR